jgi:sugar lactone lactonase YvrE
MNAALRRAARYGVRATSIALALFTSIACAGSPSAPPLDPTSGQPSSGPPSASSTDAAVVAPEAFAIGSDGQLYFSDCQAQRVFRLFSDGHVEVVAGSGPEGFEAGDLAGDGGPATEARLNCPSGLAVDDHGNLFIADAVNNRVRMVDAHGVIDTFAGSGETGLGNGGYTGDGGRATRASFDFPNGLAFDAAGNLYVTEHGNDVIRKIDTHGIISTFAGTGTGGFSGDGGPATEAQLHGPWSIVIDADGNLYFTEKENAVIREVDARGIISTIAAGGAATDAELNSPFGLLASPTGDLYIADGGNACVRVIDGTGTITSAVCS